MTDSFAYFCKSTTWTPANSKPLALASTLRPNIHTAISTEPKPSFASGNPYLFIILSSQLSTSTTGFFSPQHGIGPGSYRATVLDPLLQLEAETEGQEQEVGEKP